MPGKEKGSWYEAQFGLSKLRFRLRPDGQLEWLARGIPRRRVQAPAYRLAEQVYHATLEGEGETMDVVFNLNDQTLTLKQDLESGETLSLKAKVKPLPSKWLRSGL